MSNLPKFNFKTVDLSDEQLNEKIEADKAGDGGKFLKPGKHELQVIKSEYKGQASDATWAKWVVTYEGTGGKTITDMIMVPSSKVTYTTRNNEEGVFAVKRLKNFVEALGGEFLLKTLADTLTVYFGKEGALNGTHIGAELGYPGTHVKYMGKKDGVARLALAYKSGDLVEGAPDFTSYDDATTYCEEKGIDLKRFVEVLSYVASATGNTKRSDNW